MKIVALQAENIKKLVAIEIKPNGNLVQITGKNGQGKTSVLDCIWWALAGASNIQSTPIRKGQDVARIRLDLGEIIVTRTFKGGKEGATSSSITVENAEGARFQSPQAMLDELLGHLSFDPLSFARMGPTAQFDTLRNFVPGIDFDKLELEDKMDYAKRTDVNRRIKEAKIQADKIVIPTNTPEKLVDEVGLIVEMETAGKHNAQIEERKSRRIEAQNQLDRKNDSVTAIETQIKSLRERIDELCKEQGREMAEADTLQKKLSNAAPLPEPVDTAILMKKIATAKEINENVMLRISKRKFVEMSEKLEAEAQAITDAMKAREENKLKAISTAKLPVDGIMFGDHVILMNGVPFEQASDAEQLRASIAIAMALNPMLRVIRVRDGSLLDEDSLKLLEEMAGKEDYQVWIERVESSGKVGFVLENGHIKETING